MKTGFDNHDPELRGEAAYETYEGLRSCPVAHSDAHGGFFILTGYADIKEVSSDWETFSSVPGVMMPCPEGHQRSIALEQDPPEHTPFRRLYAELLGRSSVKAIEPYIREVTHEHVDAFAADGEGDFVARIGPKIPVQVIARMCGLDPETSAEVRERAEYVVANLTTDPNAHRPMLELLMHELEERRKNPRDDFMTRLVQAEIDGEPITEEQCGMFMAGGVVAGHETTMNAAANLIFDFATVPGLMDRLREDPALIPAAVEETLRIRPPIHDFVRTVAEDVEVHGVSMRQGEKVMMIYAAANRDPEKFPSPDTFDLDREFNHHLSFGWGIHRCVGAHLAQTELRILAEVFLPFDIELTDEPEISSMTGNGTTMGFLTLPIKVVRRNG